MSRWSPDFAAARKANMTISLAFLAPDLVKAAIDGRLPAKPGNDDRGNGRHLAHRHSAGIYPHRCNLVAGPADEIDDSCLDGPAVTEFGEIVLDTFCGSGTTILAAERVGRRGYGLEIDPGYVDVAVRRWQAFSGRDALHVASGLTFEEIGLQRRDNKKASRTSAVDKGGRR
jgi:hypothetical protein